MTDKTEKINVKGVEINLFNNSDNNNDYISLTGIAKYRSKDNPNELIRNWMRSRSSLEFLGIWEQLNNENFNNSEFEKILSATGANSFLMSPTKWINQTGAIGIQ